MNTTLKLMQLRAFLDAKKKSGKASETDLKFFNSLIDIVDDIHMDVDRIKREVCNDSFIDPSGPTRI